MTRVTRLWPIVLAGYITGCASAPAAPVPVVGSRTDLSALQGHWVGEYSSSATGRSGTIVFHLEAAADSARGEVWMLVPGWRPSEAGPPHTLSGGVPVEVLTIQFVRTAGGLVSGTLKPYLDPESGLELVTTFLGRVEGDRISGTFVTRNPLTKSESWGLWNAERKALAARDER